MEANKKTRFRPNEALIAVRALLIEQTFNRPFSTHRPKYTELPPQTVISIEELIEERVDCAVYRVSTNISTDKYQITIRDGDVISELECLNHTRWAASCDTFQELCEHDAVVLEFINHIERLAIEYEVFVQWREGLLGHYGYKVVGNIVILPPPVGRGSYLICLHEFGHISLDTNDENAAWAWAFEQASSLVALDDACVELRESSLQSHLGCACDYCAAIVK